MSGGRTIREGTPLFQEFQDCSLRDVERSLFLAASHYRRALDLMIRSSSPWAHVTLYYGSWHTARALLGMFGCAVFGNSVIDVDRGSPGRQELHIWKIGAGQGRTTYNSSHQRFWDFFYSAVRSLRPLVAPQYAAVLAPIAANPAWQSQRRNEINYDSFVGLDLARDFGNVFSQKTFPASLPGALGTQFGVCESLLTLASSYATDFGLMTDALDSLGQPGRLREKVGELVYGEKPPGLVRRTRKSSIT